MDDRSDPKWIDMAARIGDEEIIRTAMARGVVLAKDRAAVRATLDKAGRAEGLNLEEAATLMSITDPEDVAALNDAADKVKKRIYGNRIVLFAPLYAANQCVNGCKYCGYHAGNAGMKRIKLTPDELRREAEALLKMGHKRVALEAGEDPVNIPIEYIVEAMEAIYSARYRDLSIRRINVNIAATTVEEYRLLKKAGIGTYILFQESYHKPTYISYHPTGPKSNYAYHTTAMHRSMAGGVDDVGFGVLYGLYDPFFETIAMLNHAKVLEADTGVGPHTVSVPRIRAAEGVDTLMFPHALPDDQFLRIIAVLRLTLPYVGFILSTRESEDMRNEALRLGISQMSAGSCTGVGGYEVYAQETHTAQFSVEDERTPREVVESLAKAGYLPSFCTACYRGGRTGDKFMEYAKSGKIQDYCGPNALLTFKEYRLDFTPEIRDDAFFARELEKITDPKVKKFTEESLRKLEAGKRDIFI